MVNVVMEPAKNAQLYERAAVYTMKPSQDYKMNLIIWHSKADKSKFCGQKCNFACINCTLIIKTATGVAIPFHRVEGSDNSPIPQFVLGRKHSANHSLRALIATLVNPIPQQQCRGVQSMLMSFVHSVHTQATTANVVTSNHRRDHDQKHVLVLASFFMFTQCMLIHSLALQPTFLYWQVFSCSPSACSFIVWCCHLFCK